MKSLPSRVKRHHHACDALLVAAEPTVVCAETALYPMCKQQPDGQAATLGERLAEWIGEAHT